MSDSLKVLLSGGGTGGHIFPAVALAQEIQKRYPAAEFLFVGAHGKMEMEKVPQAGFKIEGLNIAGFDRGNLLKNLSLPFKVIGSLWKSRQIIRDFKPDLAIGTGGFASGPALYAAAALGIPTFLQEQNSLPGKTNLQNGKKSRAVFTAYPGMDHFFPQSSVYYLGNPVRESILSGMQPAEGARQQLGLRSDLPVILSVGGSLGSHTLNEAWKTVLPQITETGCQLLWQTGKNEFSEISAFVENAVKANPALRGLVHVREFIQDMAAAYSAAEIIVSRAGAIAISELAIAAKPVILVPFPFAAEDHQTKNAEALVKDNAALMVKDAEVAKKFWPAVLSLTQNPKERQEMAAALATFARPHATADIVDRIFQILNAQTGKNHQP